MGGGAKKVLGGASKAIGGATKAVGGLLGGKEQTYGADSNAKMLNKAAKQGIQSAITAHSDSNKLEGDPTQLIKGQIGIENKLMRGATDDAARRAQDLIAQRGMTNSSIGLGQQVNAQKSLFDKIAMNKATEAERVRDMKLTNVNRRMDMANRLFNMRASQGPMQMQTIKQKSPGIGGALGAAAGGFIGSKFGGPMGGKVGSQAGGAIGGMFG